MIFFYAIVFMAIIITIIYLFILFIYLSLFLFHKWEASYVFFASIEPRCMYMYVCMYTVVTLNSWHSYRQECKHVCTVHISTFSMYMCMCILSTSLVYRTWHRVDNTVSKRLYTIQE